MIKQIRCVVIDDDFASRAVLKGLIRQDERLILVEECSGSADGAVSITKHKPDLVFLDLMMSGLDGYEVLEVLDYMPKIIVVTTERNYKSEIFSDRISEYLYKPVESLEMFTKAVDQAMKTY